MNKKSYVTPVMTEFEILMEQAVLSNSLSYGKENQPGDPIGRVDIWGNEDL